MRIQKLNKLTAEQIAAGEVIENPASVVKELVENAIDAGASQIRITTANGGKSSIVVSDNGSGIASAEISLAFERFATSKLTSLDDLQQLTSLGFRGEALPSIAAVSRVTMVSRQPIDLGASRIKLSGGKIENIDETGSPPGTTVEVADLFYNTPGRLKFLRADSVESSRISSLVTEFALAHPEIAFTLKSGERTSFRSSGDGKLLHVIAAVYGTNIADSMIAISSEDLESGITVAGYTSSPHTTRSTRRWITLVLNGRLTRNSNLVFALERGYGDTLLKNRHPVSVLKLGIAPSIIDINVHPSKLEVRFKDPETVKNLVYRAVKSNIHKQYFHSSQSVGSADQRSSTLFSDKPNLSGSERQFSESRASYGFSEVQVEIECIENIKPIAADSSKVFGQHDYRLIGQFLNSYLLVQKGEQLLLIDQHAAHERIIYNRLQENIFSTANISKDLQLTVPYPVELPSAWAEQVEPVLKMLSEIGFNIELLGENSCVIRAVPLALHENINLERFYDLIEALIHVNLQDTEESRLKLCKTVACHRSIRAKQNLSSNEMQQLVMEWANTTLSEYCPHGRPTVISFNREQLEKSFKRR